jgi:hypothetical protein
MAIWFWVLLTSHSKFSGEPIDFDQVPFTEGNTLLVTVIDLSGLLHVGYMDSVSASIIF